MQILRRGQIGITGEVYAQVLREAARGALRRLVGADGDHLGTTGYGAVAVHPGRTDDERPVPNDRNRPLTCRDGGI